MANIRAFLVELEARLAPSLDEGLLQERLTEAEVHLRDRAQEFEEIGLPPLEAEALAVAAFGTAEEYAEDLPPAMIASNRVKADTGAAPIVFTLALILSLGLCATYVLGTQGIALAGVISVLALGFFAVLGRPLCLRTLLSLGAVTTGFLLVVLCLEFVPTASAFEPVRPHFSPEGGRAYRRLKEFDANWQQVRDAGMPPIASWRQLSEAGYIHNGAYTRRAGQQDYAAPGLDASSTVYAIYGDRQEAVAMWAQNGRFVRRLLVRSAMRGGYADELDPNYSVRIAAFAPLAVGFFIVFTAVAALARSLGTGLRGGIGRVRGLLRGREVVSLPTKAGDRP